MKNICFVVLISFVSVLTACTADQPTQPTLTEEDVARIVAEELAKMNDADDALTPQDIASIALKSTVYLRVKTASGNFYGSGFVIGDKLIATCDHVLEGMTSATVESVFNDKQYAVTKILAVSKKHDLAIVLALSYSAPPLPLGDSNTVKIADNIFVTGNPLKYRGIVSDGIVSAIHPAGVNKLVDSKTLQITASVSTGSSGGPVLNTKGEVIGIILSGEHVGQNLNFAVPSNRLSALLSTLK